MSRALLAVLFALAALAPAAQAAELGPDDLKLVDRKQLSPRLWELTFQTPAVAHDTPVRILLPAGYDADAGARYPVLWLLHGGQDDYRSWTTKGDAEAITAGEPLIVVMPDSGPGNGYQDWFNNGEGGPPMWRTYHIKQLLPWIDAHYRTIARREGRAIAGLSMGGGGTMHYAARHPDLFVSATSWSGAVNTNSLGVMALAQIEGSSQGRLPTEAAGLRLTQEINWRANNPWDLAENLGGLRLTLRTGNGMPGGPGGDTGDPIEAEVHSEGVSMHERLGALGIPHVWDDYGAGGHNWFYWQRGLRQLVPELRATFADPPAPPDPVVYKSDLTDYEVFGWRVAIRRPAREFSVLSASRGGFVLRGSGEATVTTPPLYRAGTGARLRIASGSGVETRSVTVGGDCRLKVPITLGPGNPYQQYSPEARLLGTQRALSDPAVTASRDNSGTLVYATRVSIDPASEAGCAAAKRKHAKRKRRAAARRKGRR